MASESVKNVQGKLFRGAGEGSIKQDVRAGPGLAIHIPKPPSTAPTPPKTKPIPDNSPKEGIESAEAPRRYCERLIEQLGAQYKGVEKYRLLQDEEKERHWKKWGPYLSERQWVSTT